MAITKVRRTEDWSGTLNQAGKANYTVAYVVETDSEDHGIQDIAEADDGTDKIPDKGDSYEFGNDLDGLAVASSYNVRRIDKFLWHVQVKYEPLKDKTGRMTENGEPTDDWRIEGPTIEVRPVQVSRPADFGAYIGKIKRVVKGPVPGLHGPFIGVAGTFDGQKPWSQHTAIPAGPRLFGGIKNAIPVTNSAFVPFDPPPEADYSRLSITITRNHYRFPTKIMGDYQDVVNSDEFLININGFTLNVPPTAAKMQSTSGSREYADESPFWRVRYEMLLDFFTGWRVDLLDRGFVETKTDDESADIAAAHGDFASATSTTTHNIIDDTGLPMSEPVLLDGKGKKLSKDEPPVYLRYAIYQERPFKPLLFDRPGPILIMPEK